MFKKVISSHSGEKTESISVVGDVVRYRIYIDRPRVPHSDLLIVDNLDRALTRITAFDGGSYDRRTHTVTWRLKWLHRLRKPYVELEAQIAAKGEILNQAQIEAPGMRPRLSNRVLTRAVAKPKVGWISLDDSGETGKPPKAYMKDETSMGLTVNFDISGVHIRESVIGRVTYHHVRIPQRATLMKLGEPQMPIIGALVEVPRGVDIDAAIAKSAHTRLMNYNVHPAQKPIPRQTRGAGAEFVIDGPTYLADALYPGDLAVIENEDIGVIRGHRLVFLKVNPVQFNPVTRELDLYSNIEVQLRFNRPGQIEEVPDRIQSSAFEALLQNAVMNYKQPERFARGGDYQKEVNGCHYLILTHPDFYNPSDASNPIVMLQNWKRKKGLITRVTDVTAITGGNTAAAIRNYIQNAYDTWNPAPTYVLIVGDDERIPTNTGLLHHLHAPGGAATPIGTDLDFSTVDGSDYFPDVFLGRLPASTATEVATMVDKIITYEQTPPNPATDPHYYRDTSLVCLFEDVAPDPLPTGPPGGQGDGGEDNTFRIIEFAEAIRGHLRGAGYNVERIYSRSGVFGAGPQQYENGTNLPDELTLAGNPGAGIPGFPWNGGTADIRAAFTNGNFLISYNGHGARRSWSQPGFTAVDAGNLANGGLTPVVFSFACETGWFDNSTDAASLGTAAADEALSEVLMTNAAGGAVAVLGATRISWENNDSMMLGAYMAVWPEFDPNPPSSLPLPDMEIGPLPRMGQILQFSKIYMANVYPHDFNRESSFEMYHLFGDPEMPIWTAAPGELAVAHPEGIGATGGQGFVVEVTDRSGGTAVRSAAVMMVLGLRQWWRRPA
ncbi:MAG: C25 family cysteine peptidase [Planctomycetes bacterium]|nr:C25 family cysteine peptidase [Planctomycetota bacterium]